MGHPDPVGSNRTEGAALYPQTADNSVKQKRYPFDSPWGNFTFMAALDVVSVSELVHLGFR